MTREEAIQYWQFRLDNAKDYIDPHWEADERKAHREYVEALTMAIEALKTEVVRCWECKKQFTNNCYMIYGKNMMRNLFDNDFCSYGERREP